MKHRQSPQKLAFDWLKVSLHIPQTDDLGVPTCKVRLFHRTLGQVLLMPTMTETFAGI